MSKSRACIEKSVNIAKTKCTKKTNLLVYEKDYAESCNKARDAAYVPKIPCPKAKQIRVCTGAELKKICAPITCKCKPGPPETLFQKLRKFFVFGIKSAITGGVIYSTIQVGVWGDNCQTQALYKDICKFFGKTGPPPKTDVGPACKQEQELFENIYQDCCDRSFIDHERSAQKWGAMYNRAVFCVFSAIAGFPMNLIHAIQSKIKQCSPDNQICEDDKTEDFSGPYDTIGGDEKCPEEDYLNGDGANKGDNGECVCE